MKYEIYILRKGNWELLGEYSQVTSAWEDVQLARKHYAVKLLDLTVDKIVQYEKLVSVS